jgi:hypothetical protein
VIVIDLNLLLHAVNRDAIEHAAAKAWVEDVLSGDEPVGLRRVQAEASRSCRVLEPPFRAARLGGRPPRPDIAPGTDERDYLPGATVPDSNAFAHGVNYHGFA